MPKIRSVKSEGEEERRGEGCEEVKKEGGAVADVLPGGKNEDRNPKGSTGSSRVPPHFQEGPFHRDPLFSNKHN